VTTIAAMPLVENFLCFDLYAGGYAIGTFEVREVAEKEFPDDSARRRV
jgi:hypothetical protein